MLYINGKKLIEGVLENGAVATPALTFSTDPDSGLYRIGANNLGIGVNGAKVLDIAANSLGVTGDSSATVSLTSPLLKTAANASTMTVNIPVSGADAGAHTIALQVDGNTAFSVAATGDGGGGVGARTVTIGSGWTASGQTCTDLGTVTTADIDGGTADAVVIGGASAAAGTFTTVVAGTSVSSPSYITAANAAAMTVNIPVSGADAGAHTIDLQIDGNSALSIAATGDGGGAVGARTIQIGVSGAADTVTIGDANAIVAITDAHWSITELGALSIASMAADWTNAGRTVADAGILTTVDINGGSVDGTAIGAASASTGVFTTLTGQTAILAGTGEGGVVAATGQIVRAPNVATGGAGNVVAADLTLAAGLGTGTGDEGQIIFRAAPLAGVGDNLQALTTLMTLDGSGQLRLDCGIQLLRTAVGDATNSAAASTYFGCDSVGSDTITILSAHIAMSGRVFIIKDEGGNAAVQPITIATEGAETIDGQASVQITSGYGYLHLISDGANLFVINDG